MSGFLLQTDFEKALGRVRSAQRPASWQKTPAEKIRDLLSRPYKPKTPHTLALGNGRRITVPSAEDRIIQGAILQAILRHLNPPEHEGTHQLREKLSRALSAHPQQWIVQTDIAKFFDQIDTRHALDSLSRTCKLSDPWVVNALNAICPGPKGVPQGSPLSPIIAETALRPVDQALQGRGLRYVDDIILWGSSKAEVEKLRNEIADILMPLQLHLSADKTRTIHYPSQSFVFLGEHYPPQPAQELLISARTGSTGLGFTPYPSEEPQAVTIIAGGPSRQVTPDGIQMSKEYFLRNLTEKPSLDTLLVLASVETNSPAPWGKSLRDNRNLFLCQGMAKPLHDTAFKLYVGKVKPLQEKASPADAARVMISLIVGNSILKNSSFPKDYVEYREKYENGLQELLKGNYQQYRSEVSKLFKENYALRQNNSLPDTSLYEEQLIDKDHDCLEISN